MATDRVTIFDTTLRDGEQAPGFSLRTSEKVQLAKELDALGVDFIEAGFPIASIDDAEGVRQVAASVRRPIIAALARCRPEDIERAYDLGANSYLVKPGNLDGLMNQAKCLLAWLRCSHFASASPLPSSR